MNASEQPSDHGDSKTVGCCIVSLAACRREAVFSICDGQGFTPKTPCAYLYWDERFW